MIFPKEISIARSQGNIDLGNGVSGLSGKRVFVNNIASRYTMKSIRQKPGLTGGDNRLVDIMLNTVELW